MRDDIDTTSGDAFMAAFRTRAEAEFARRMDRVSHLLAEVTSHPEAREAFAALVAMDPMLRTITIGAMGGNPSGAQSLEGTEALLAFVNGCIVQGHECHVVPYVPSSLLQQVHMRSAMALARGDQALADERQARWLAKEAEFSEFRRGPAPDDTVLGAAAILGLIAQNERVEAGNVARRAEFAKRRDAALARLDASEVGQEASTPSHM